MILHKNSDHRRMLEIWQNALVKSSCLIIPVTIFAMVLAHDVVVFLFSDRYAASVPIFRIFCLVLPFKMVSYEAMFHASNKNGYFAFVSIVTLVVFVLLLVAAVDHWGILGAVVATVFVEICVRFALYLVFIGKTVGAPARTVVPIRRLWRSLWPALALACPLLLRPLLDLPPALSLVLCGLYYFSACYLWLTRKAEAPRLAAVETLLARVRHGFGLPDGICADRSSR
jgi:O-antigen/teichoic acid export membrane protein